MRPRHRNCGRIIASMDNKTEQFDLRRLGKIIRKNWHWVVIPAVLMTAAATTFSLLREKQYDATVIMLAGQGEGIADVSAIDAITKATQTLARMGTNRVVIEQALRDLDLEESLDPVTVAEGVRAAVPVNTQQIEITVRDSDPERSARLANAIGEAFSHMVEQRASEQSNLSATVWQPALVPQRPASPNSKFNALIGLLIGSFVGFVLALLRERFDQGWRGEEELEQLLGVPVLVSVPDVRTGSKMERVYA